MKDMRAYREFLEEISSRADVWRAPQREIADWWKRRQSARIYMRVEEKGMLLVSCSLEDSAVEVGGMGILSPPISLPISESTPPGEVKISYRCREDLREFMREMLGHLGMSHLVECKAQEKCDIEQDSIDPLLERLRETAAKHKKYDTKDREELKAVIARAHRERGIPDVRIWTLPAIAGRAYRVAFSPRYDVDKAIVNMPAIQEMEARYGVKSTAYLRPYGLFYGEREIKFYRERIGDNEIALHAEFVTTARKYFGDEYRAAAREKARLEDIIGMEVRGVCLHGGELTYNYTTATRAAVEAAGFEYETLWRNGYFLPLHLPSESGTMRCLSIGQHLADIDITPNARFAEALCKAFREKLESAEREGGVFVPVMHPLYFDLGNYLRRPENLARIAVFVPRYLGTVLRMRGDSMYANKQ